MYVVGGCSNPINLSNSSEVRSVARGEGGGEMFKKKKKTHKSLRVNRRNLIEKF